MLSSSWTWLKSEVQTRLPKELWKQPYHECMSLLISSRNVYEDERTLKWTSRKDLGETEHDTLPSKQNLRMEVCFQQHEHQSQVFLARATKEDFLIFCCHDKMTQKWWHVQLCPSQALNSKKTVIQHGLLNRTSAVFF